MSTWPITAGLGLGRALAAAVIGAGQGRLGACASRRHYSRGYSCGIATSSEECS